MGKGGAGKGKDGGKGGPPPPPAAPAGKGKPRPAPAPARPVVKAGGGLNLGAVKLKKVAVVERVRRPPTHVKGVPLWLNLPPEACAPATEEGFDLLGHLFAAGAKVVLVDFFAYSCTNCLRVVPVLKRWHEAYAEHGLQVVAFHRPEFDFERDAINMLNFVLGQGVPYPVGLDNKDAAWNDWKVDMWPSSFLVVPDKEAEGQYKIIKEHYGDRNHHEVETLIRARTIGPGDVQPINSTCYADAEFFLGKGHRFKNRDSGASCGLGACKIRRRGDPDEVGEVREPGSSGRVIYGAPWCRFCRKAKMLHEKAGLDYEYVDVEDAGGAQNVFSVLRREGLLPEDHSTLPAVYNSGEFVGGYSELVESLRGSLPELDGILEEIEAASMQSFAEFDKFGHTLSATMSGWDVKDDFMLAREEASLTLQMSMTSKEAVHVFVVASFQDLALEEKRAAALGAVTREATVGQEGISYFSGEVAVEPADFRGLLGPDPVVFAEDEVPPPVVRVATGEDEAGQDVEIKGAGRQYLATAEAVGEDAVQATFRLSFTPGIKVYTFFLTSEPLVA